MELKFKVLFFIVLLSVRTRGELCPKQCDCDSDDGLNRATCVNQNIIGIDVGVPKEVQVYSLSHNVISELDNFCFMEIGYISIQVLNLSYNLIFWIGLHAFSGLDHLIHLDLSSNRLRQIPSDLFWDTPELQTLDLSGNIFEALNNEPFLMHNKLQILNLKDCRIKFLPERLFTRLPNIRKLDLSENYMVTLKTEVLRPLRKLERIELRNDYWRCDPGFINLETWIISHSIAYDKQCKKKMPKMSEKMISAVVTERGEVDVNDVWNVTVTTEKVTTVVPQKPMTPIEKFDKEFSSFQAFIIGVEIGLGVGIVGTYVWLRKFCKCGQLDCSRPDARRERRRVQRADADMRTNLLWSSVINPDLETPPLYRRQVPLPPTLGLHVAGLQVDAIRAPRAETPPPPYNECRINI